MNGRIFTYSHHDGSCAAWVEVSCQTDFAARTEEFKGFGGDLAMHIASVVESERTGEELAMMPWFGDEHQIVQDKLDRLEADLGETIEITRFERIVQGE